MVAKTFQILATCGDDDPAGCDRIELQPTFSNSCLQGTPLAVQFGSTFDLLYTTPSLPGGNTTRCLLAFDSSGQTGVLVVNLWVESDELEEVAVVDGLIVDANSTRLLHVGDLTGRPLVLHDRSTGDEEVIATASGALRPRHGEAFLTPGGAIFEGSLDAEGLERKLFEWNQATLTALNSAEVEELQVAGHWAAWRQESAGGNQLYRRNLTSQISQLVTTGC